MLRELFQQQQPKPSEDMLKQQEKKFNELIAQFRDLERQEEELYRGVGLDPEKLLRYLDDRSNFTEAEQIEIQRQIDEHEQKRGNVGNSLFDCLRLRKTYNERSQVQQHWMFVK